MARLITLILAFTLLGGGNILAENPTDSIQPDLTQACDSLGPNKDSTLDNYALYADYFKSKSYDLAASFWRYVFFNAPGFHKSVHQNGVLIYEDKIARATVDSIKQGYVDTLLMIYDKRIECFGDVCYSRGRKAYALMQHRPKATQQMLEMLNEAFNECEGKMEYFLVHSWVRLNCFAFSHELITQKELLAVVERLNSSVEQNANGPYYEQWREQQAAAMDEVKRVLDINIIRDFYLAEYFKHPEDPKVWRKFYENFRNSEVYNDTVLEVYTKLYKAEPDVELARMMAQTLIKLGRAGEALQYFDQAIEMETDEGKKADLAQIAAEVLYGEKEFSKSRTYALKAAKLRPGWGKPYLLIGKLYAASGPRCGSGTGWNSQIVVWPALDKWYQAKSMDAEVAKEAQELINKYSQYMPTVQQGFDRGITEGSTITVGCWINETTKVRFSK